MVLRWFGWQLDYPEDELLSYCWKSQLRKMRWIWRAQPSPVQPSPAKQSKARLCTTQPRWNINSVLQTDCILRMLETHSLQGDVSVFVQAFDDVAPLSLDCARAVCFKSTMCSSTTPGDRARGSNQLICSRHSINRELVMACHCRWEWFIKPLARLPCCMQKC